MHEPDPELYGDEPLQTLTRDGVHYWLLGTAHVSQTSARVVRALVESGRFDAVAIELCGSRHQALTDQNRWQDLNLFAILRQRKGGMMMASLALASYQRRIARQLGVEPGAEMKAAIEAADAAGLPVQLIDREIGVTLKRCSRRISWWRRLMLINGLILSTLSRDQVEAEDIEKLKQGDLLEQTFSEFAGSSPELYETLITERDDYMAARLLEHNRDQAGRRVLAVLGAGHLQGTAKALEQLRDPRQRIAALDRTPPPSKLFKLLPWLILVAVISGFAVGFARSPELGWALVSTWVVINGSLSALGALIARAHPLTILTALIAAPITSLNPTIGAGMVTGAVEAWLRKPRVVDFQRLGDDVVRLSGWWNNRVARVFLVFFLSNLGSAAGTWIAGFRMFSQLAGA